MGCLCNFQMVLFKNESFLFSIISPSSMEKGGTKTSPWTWTWKPSIPRTIELPQQPCKVHLWTPSCERLFCLLAAAAKSLQSCPTLCDPIDSSPPGSPVPGILQARILEWVAISFSNAWKWKVKSEVTQLCLTLSDLMDCSLPGTSVHGIFQARVL